MSLIVTPPLNPTETLQVATPLSYSFTYSTPVTVVDTPVYYFQGGVFSSSNSTNIKCLDTQNPASGYGLTYTVSNMTPTTDILECVLPILAASYSFDSGSYVTFGGPTRLDLSGGPSNGAGTVTGHFATFGTDGPFQYGAYNSLDDSLKYTTLSGTPVSSFRITLARPNITGCSVDCSISANTMTVTGVTSGLVNVGMIFPIQGGPSGLTRAFTVTAFGTGKGNLGTYTVAPNDGGSALTTGSLSISSTNVAGSGNIILSNSMTPSSGTAKFEISTSFTYTPEV